MYLRFVVVANDHSEALKGYRKAVKQGNVEAQINLGVIYNLGWTYLNGVGATVNSSDKLDLNYVPLVKLEI